MSRFLSGKVVDYNESSKVWDLPPNPFDWCFIQSLEGINPQQNQPLAVWAQERGPAALQTQSSRSDETWSRKASLLSPCPPRWDGRAGTGSDPQIWNVTFEWMKKAPWMLLTNEVQTLFQQGTCLGRAPAGWRGKAGCGGFWETSVGPSEEKPVCGHAALVGRWRKSFHRKVEGTGSASQQTSSLLVEDLLKVQQGRDYSWTWSLTVDTKFPV